jgi:hypothetical protein
MSDFHDRYLRGVGDLLQAIEPADEAYLAVLTLQGRLAEAIAETRQYGPTDNARAEIARVTGELDRLCLARFRQSFRSFCGIDVLPQVDSPSIYHNLPQPDYEEFVGREKELAEIHRLLSPSSRHFLITIDGIGGIGKSTLALEVAHRYLEKANDFPITERFEAIIWTSAKQSILATEGIVQRAQSLVPLRIFTRLSASLLSVRTSHVPVQRSKLNWVQILSVTSPMKVAKSAITSNLKLQKWVKVSNDCVYERFWRLFCIRLLRSGNFCTYLLCKKVVILPW